VGKTRGEIFGGNLSKKQETCHGKKEGYGKNGGAPRGKTSLAKEVNWTLSEIKRGS